MAVKKKKTEITVYLGSDSIEVNGYLIHEYSLGEIAVYSPEHFNLKDDLKEYIDYPNFKYMCNAISYCLGYTDKNILDQEEDLKEYLERNEMK